jgi:hypothetical protein
MATSELTIKVRVAFGWKMTVFLAVLMLLATVHEVVQGHYVGAIVTLGVAAVHLMELYVARRMIKKQQAAE